MLTTEQNELLTRIGPGTRMGNLLRRYWHPIAPLVDMEDRWTKRIRLLGEDLVLFRDRLGGFGLIAEACPHRRASLAYGIPAIDGIRCPYHGWKFDATGRCIEQPNEPEDSTFKDKVGTTAYPVGELGGLLWAYLGPLPAPGIPRLDGLVVEGAIRFMGRATIPCNWLQIMENSVDPVHTEWLHGKLTEFVREAENWQTPRAKHHVKVAFDEFEYGIIKRRLMEGQTEDASDWVHGHPVVFPLTLAVGTRSDTWRQYQFQLRVPIDDTHTEHYWYSAYIPPRSDIPRHLLERVPVYEAPMRDERGEFLMDYINAQDALAWITQGPIADRTVEKLGTPDRGVMMFRKMLLRELEKVESGSDPMFVFRGAAGEATIDLPVEYQKDMQSDGFRRVFMTGNGRFSPVADEILALFEGVLV
ncbi:MAG: aromatic ring-hydroxylating dioxygenase subunit alpha [Candidatus Lustribacter sp.]|jgi:5,5'-dehydrodivanillate O-demethylase